MEQQSGEQASSKLTRSQLRHLRRKKLIAARKEAEKNLLFVPESKKDTISLSEDITESAVNVEKSSNFTSTHRVDTNNVKNKKGNNKSKTNVSDLLKSETITVISETIKNNESFCISQDLNTTNISENSRVELQTIKTCEENNIKSVTQSVSKISDIMNKESTTMNMDSEEKLREQVKAERAAKKAAKAEAKLKNKVKSKEESVPPSQPTKVETSEIQEKLKKVSIVNSQNNDTLATQPISETVALQKNKTIDKHKSDEDKKVENLQKTEEKSKAELRAERRAKQEAQRAAKQALLNEQKKPVKKALEKSKEKSISPVDKRESVKKVIVKSEIKENVHEVNLFKHLYMKRKNISQLINTSNVNIHPAILRLGVQYNEKVIVGSNARCVALLAAIKQHIRDFERPSQADFTRGLEASLQESVNYLNLCRPSAVSMQNALKHLKWQMSTLPSTVPDEEAKLKLETAIDTYIQEQILLADKAISESIQNKISNGDVILTYGFSSLIHKILCDAYSAGKQFRVVVVDGRPWLEGKELLRRLVKHGIDCSYMLINALSFIMPQVNKVFLGAHAILANGAVMSRVGTAQVALIANAFNVPVLVACETHKSCERVQTDSIVYNEIGDPDQLIKNMFCNTKKSCLSNWKIKKSLNLLNITYDVTPADLVTAVVTELAILPCTSVPVILRIKPSEI